MLRSDSDLQLQIIDELKNDVGCKSADIDVVVKNGVVTLSGPVHDLSVARAAVCAVKRIFGVEGIERHFALDAQLATAGAGSPTPLH